VQRPLATAVIFGIVGATVLMLVVFPSILRLALKGWAPEVIAEPAPAAEPTEHAPSPS
jgi:hypothetical protein